MRLEYDHQADAIYISLSSKGKKVWKSKEVEEGVILDLNKKKEIIGIEILEASKRLRRKELFEFSVKHAGYPYSRQWHGN